MSNPVTRSIGASRLPNLLKVGATVVSFAVLAVFGKLTWEQAGIYRDEISFYTHIVSFNPEARSIHRNLAKALNDAGRPAEALGASRIALKQAPGSARAHNSHGAALLALDRCDEAGESFGRALELDPGHKYARHNMASTLRCQGRFEEAIEWYKKALDTDPEYGAAHVGMGRALFRLRRYEQAEESLARAMSLRSDTPIDAFQLLADALRAQRRHGEAIERYRVVLEIDPDYAPAHAGIGYALLEMQRYEEAAESLARSVSIQPASPAVADRHVAMGRAFLALGRTEASEEHFARALAIDPDNTKALDSLAVLRFQQQRYEEALRLYETLIDLGEGGAQAHANVGATLYYLGRPEEAHRSLERARALDPTLKTGPTGLEKTRGTSQQEQE